MTDEIERYRLPDVAVPPATNPQPPRRNRREPFLSGAIPLAWLSAAERGRALATGVLLWHLVALKKSRTVKWRPKLAREFGLVRQRVYRNLRWLAGKDLIRLESRRGQTPIVTVLVPRPSDGEAETS